MYSHSYKISDFTIVKQLGKGGFGKAYLARRNSDGIEVCLKEIPLNRSISKQSIEREAKIMSELNNQYIIRYYGSFVESENFYIVMEYANEGSLADMITVCYIALLFISFFCFWLSTAESYRLRPSLQSTRSI